MLKATTFSLLALASVFAGAAAADKAPARRGHVVVDVHQLPAAPLPEAPVTTERARSTFAARCANCHGATGRGDGPAARALTPKPRDFSRPDWQAAVDDELITKAIRLGGTAVKKSPVMPPHPDLDGDHLAEVITLLRSFKRRGVATVMLSLQSAAHAKEPEVLANKRVRLSGDAVRARFKEVDPGDVRVRGFVDLDGDAVRDVDEPGFETPTLTVVAGAEAKHAVRLKREARPPQEPRTADPQP